VDVAEPIAAELRRSAGNQAIDIKALDLSDLRSVKAFTDAWEGPLDILVNNAGIMAVPELEKTPQGFELQFGTNFLGHFALTIGLHTALAAANGAARPSSRRRLHRPRHARSQHRHPPRRGEPCHCSDEDRSLRAPRPVKSCLGSCALRRVAPACCVIRVDPPMPSPASG
jgi:NAD(P)-dependent dehydrogenase (short-subunit alcohol dehydrogenase family)